MKIVGRLQDVSPLAGKLLKYDRAMLLADLVGGCVVAVMLVPQSMAYAMLAGLPPQVGLYASIVPLLLYAFFGSSKSLAVGPVAMLSLLVVSGLSAKAAPGSPEFLELCLSLAFLVGGLQILMAIFRMGFLLNFISHPVLKGFTSAAAIIIGFSQLKHLLGVKIPEEEYPFLQIYESLRALPGTNLVTFALGAASLVLLLLMGRFATPLLKQAGLSDTWATPLSKFGPLVAVALTGTVVGLFHLDQQFAVGVVGEIPSGLPRLTLPSLTFERVVDLLPLAVIIALVGFLESFSVAKALASRDREKVDANNELFGLGMADLGAAFTGGYPVTGGFSRSLVCHNSGVRTQLSGVVTALLVAVAVMFAAPVFYFIPRAVLAAIIIVAVVSLIDLRTPWLLWRYSRHDAVAFIATFAAVLMLGIEKGILVGVATTAALLMWRVSRPHIAEVGRIAGSEHFRNIRRFEVQTHPQLVFLRFDASLNFSNAPYLESHVQNLVADRPKVKQLVLICSGINDIDATGIETVERIRDDLAVAGVELYLSDVKGPVMDRLNLSAIERDFLIEHVFLSADEAFSTLTQRRVELPTSEVAVAEDSSAAFP